MTIKVNFLPISDTLAAVNGVLEKRFFGRLYPRIISLKRIFVALQSKLPSLPIAVYSCTPELAEIASVTETNVPPILKSIRELKVKFLYLIVLALGNMRLREITPPVPKVVVLSS